MARNLVIVESPAKTRTLTKILGKGYNLMASMGHIRDLPRSALGVDVEHGFIPKYVVPRERGKLAKELKQAAAKSTTVYLATDPDREGEAIAWHLMQIVDSDHKSYKRVVFHEITEEAVKSAFQHPRTINMKLVNAQQARRILDRLVGYRISPLLWKKVRRGLSAGRVQSVAVRIIVDREREIEAFVPVEYWNIEAELTRKTKADSFKATLIGLADGSKAEIHTAQEANTVKALLEKSSYSVTGVSTKKALRQPAPPFITSTLQQEAARKLRFTAKQTMAIAQQLYEGLPVGEEGDVGLITYMRTDSPRVAQTAIGETREFIGEHYGADYLPAKARVFSARAKGAQEAHEAIRPTRIHREPDKIKKHLNTNQFKLYSLIWNRMVASQMSAAQFSNTSVDIEAAGKETKYLFRATSSVNIFPGFMVLYIESRDDAEDSGRSSPLPHLKKGDLLKLLDIIAQQRFTQPPPRFTEASLVKTLEQYGIGRPSTYAPIISTIQEREYVTKEKGSFKPTQLGFVVNDLLTSNFPDIVSIEFTASMENELDAVAADNKDWVSVVKDFYEPLEKDIQKASQLLEKVKLPDELTEEKCPKCGRPLAVKVGRYGKFLACSGYPECKYTQPYQIKLGVKCPECGSELVEKVSKKKRTFYGCSNYPNCKFAMNVKPLPQPCPECGGLLAQSGKMIKCTKCTYKNKAEQE